jgi:hypothetical protein
LFPVHQTSYHSSLYSQDIYNSPQKENQLGLIIISLVHNELVGSGRGLIWGPMSAFAWWGWGKHWHSFSQVTPIFWPGFEPETLGYEPGRLPLDQHVRWGYWLDLSGIGHGRMRRDFFYSGDEILGAIMNVSSVHCRTNVGCSDNVQEQRLFPRRCWTVSPRHDNLCHCCAARMEFLSLSLAQHLPEFPRPWKVTSLVAYLFGSRRQQTSSISLSTRRQGRMLHVSHRVWHDMTLIYISFSGYFPYFGKNIIGLWDRVAVCGLCGRDVMCFLWGTNWICIYYL